MPILEEEESRGLVLDDLAFTYLLRTTIKTQRAIKNVSVNTMDKTARVVLFVSSVYSEVDRVIVALENWLTFEV